MPAELQELPCCLVRLNSLLSCLSSAGPGAEMAQGKADASRGQSRTALPPASNVQEYRTSATRWMCTRLQRPVSIHLMHGPAVPDLLATSEQAGYQGSKPLDASGWLHDSYYCSWLGWGITSGKAPTTLHSNTACKPGRTWCILATSRSDLAMLFSGLLKSDFGHNVGKPQQICTQTLLASQG